ncbi:MAG: Hpt domain-containing protein [Gammaproteobacteria bacterium]|nr:Hpt domain-containing protein [Gammaproteobacteria bacterium]
MDNVLDLQALEELREVMEDDFSLLIQTFLNDAPVRIDELKSALSAGDVLGLEKPAHTLKGSSSNIGATALSRACAKLVDDIRAGTVENPSADIKSIESLFELTNSALQHYL